MVGKDAGDDKLTVTIYKWKPYAIITNISGSQAIWIIKMHKLKKIYIENVQLKGKPWDQWFDIHMSNTILAVTSNIKPTDLPSWVPMKKINIT